MTKGTTLNYGLYSYENSNVLRLTDAGNDTFPLTLLNRSATAGTGVGIEFIADASDTVPTATIVSNTDGNLLFTDGNNTDVSLSTLAAGGGGSSDVQISYTTCPDDTTTHINIGDDTAPDISFQIHYVAERDIMGTPYYQAGEISVLYNDWYDTIFFDYSFIGDDIGMTITADYSGGDIRLNVIVDDTNTADLSFDYTITSKFYK